jgi:V/A-type H+-transporting ATPase subunit F
VRRAALIVTRPGDAVGFRLAGVRVEEVEEGAEVDRLTPLLRDPGVGLLVIEDDVLRRVPETLLDAAARTGLPVVFPIALPRRLRERGGAEAYVAELVRRAIGYHVRLSW